jgi:hypothetical protein
MLVMSMRTLLPAVLMVTAPVQEKVLPARSMRECAAHTLLAHCAKEVFNNVTLLHLL